MRNNSNFISVFTGLMLTVTIVSCDKILDTKPRDFVAVDTYYKTKTDISNAIAGIYSNFTTTNMYGSNFIYDLSIGNDEAYFRGSTSVAIIGVRVQNVNSSDPNVAGAWNSIYACIDRTNNLLAALPESPVDEIIKKSSRSEALFLRGLLYFLLADNWGNVPLRLKPTTSTLDADFPQSVPKDIFDQITSDLIEAEQGLPTITELGATGSGRPSKSAVQGLLARVYLTMAGKPLNDISKFQDAKMWAAKTITSNLHSLNPDYRQIFINQSQDKYDIKESIFEIEFKNDPTGANPLNGFGRVGYVNGIKCDDLDTGGCNGQVSGTKKLYDLYENNDVRRNWNIAPYGYTAGSPASRVNYTATQIWDRWPGKWRRSFEVAIPKHRINNGTNFPIIRYADILLMYAEAENELNGPTSEAFNAVNLVRIRAGASAVNLTTIPSKLAFRNMIIDERMRELCFENLRTHDLKRWGIFISTMKVLAADIIANAPANFRYAALAGNNVSDKNLLLPIPVGEFINKKIIQNTGY